MQVRVGDTVPFGETDETMILQRPTMPGHYFRRIQNTDFRAQPMIPRNQQWESRPGEICKRPDDPVVIVAILKA